MPVWKLQTSMWVNSVLPRDAWVVTPHFNDGGIGTDPQQLCEDWAAAVATLTGSERQVTVKAYDAQGTEPVYPQGEFTLLSGLAPAARSPGEVALCLSFYSERNVKRRRGRIYLPISAQFAGLTARPTTGHWDYAEDWAEAAQALGGPDVDWVVYSKADFVSRPVTNWWVDDEWDTVRSRGLQSSDRRIGATSEA